MKKFAYFGMTMTAIAAISALFANFNNNSDKWIVFPFFILCFLFFAYSTQTNTNNDKA